MNPDSLDGPRSYLDFAGLGELRGRASTGKDPEALRQAARQFEAHFLQSMFKSMREATVIRGELLGSQEQDTWQEMMDREVATKMAGRGSLGIASLIERHFAAGGVTPTLADTRRLLESHSAGLPLPAQPAAAAASVPPPGAGFPLPLGAPAMPLPAAPGAAFPLPVPGTGLPLSPPDRTGR